MANNLHIIVHPFVMPLRANTFFHSGLVCLLSDNRANDRKMTGGRRKKFSMNTGRSLILIAGRGTAIPADETKVFFTGKNGTKM
jgi:hypothetical protein